MERSKKPVIDKNNRTNQDSSWKSGLQSGTGLDDYRLDVMKLN
jgi:hypothetical protein